MAGVKLNHVYKVYDNGVKAVSDFCIDIQDKEFIVFVGPSGCGKSTTLRMIAGLEDITSGELYIDDHLVNEVEPQDRDIAMVFQNYALYPHMTVYDNMAFALKNIKVPKAEIEQRVHEAATILGLEEYLDRKPKEMSGGQRQRVALGRAIVRNPKVFLLDEPLSNLDAKLRASMRTEISKIHRKLETTFIYVTHDQVEAMTMGTRIVVMRDGFVQQIDTPINLFNYPVNKFVAGFIGTPQMNFFNVTLDKKGDKLEVYFDKQHVSFPYINYTRLDSRYLKQNKEVILGIRPDHIMISKKETPLKVRVALIEQLGIESILYGDLLLENGDYQPIVVKIPQGEMFNPNDVVYVELNDEWLHLFDKETEESICLKEPENNYIKTSTKDEHIRLFEKDIKMPPVFEHLKNQDVTMVIPVDAIIEGKDFSLKTINTRYDGNGYITLQYGDEYMTANGLDSKAKTFAINWSRVTILHDDEVIVAGCPKELQLKVNLKKIKAKRLVEIHKKKNVKTEHGIEIQDRVIEKEKNVALFTYDLFGKEQEIDYKESTKLLDIFGRNVTKNSFEIHIDLSFVKTGTAYSFPVKEIVDYGKDKMIKFVYNESEHLLPMMSSDSSVQFSIDIKGVSLYESTSQIKIF